MTFQAGAIRTTLGVDINPYAQGMLQATSIAQIFPATVTNFLANPLLGVIGIAKDVTSSIIGIFQGAQENADKLNDMATAVGVNVEELSALGLVARQAGAGIDAAGDAYKFLSFSLAEVKKGKQETIDLFDSLGVSTLDAAGNIRPLEAVMMDLADAFARLQDGNLRNAAAKDLLGRGGIDMLPTLRQGSAAIQDQMDRYKRWGATVTEESARSADAWGDAMGEIDIAWTGVKNVLGEELRIGLLPELEKLLGWIDQNQPEIRAAFRDLSEVMKGLIPIIRVIGAEANEALKNVLAMMDAVGLTDPNKRFGNPYGSTAKNDVAGGMSGSDLAGIDPAEAAVQAEKIVNSTLGAANRAAKALDPIAGGALGEWAKGGAQAALQELDKWANGLQKLKEQKLSVMLDAGKRGMHIPQEEWDAILSQLEGTLAAIDKARDSLHTTRASVQNDWHPGVDDDQKATIDANLDLMQKGVTARLEEARNAAKALREAKAGVDAGQRAVDASKVVDDLLLGVPDAADQKQPTKEKPGVGSENKPIAHDLGIRFQELDVASRAMERIVGLESRYSASGSAIAATTKLMHAEFDGLRPSLDAAEAGLASLTGQMREYIEVARSFPTAGPGVPAGGQGQGGVTVNVNGPRFDVNADQITATLEKKLMPLIKQAIRESERSADHVSTGRRAVQGMGGIGG